MSSELFQLPADHSATSSAGETSLRGESQSLYRKYRPQSFAESELVGQEHIVQTLRNAIVLDRVAHAYLFCGPRGTGKTTTARLLAKAVNCLDDDPNNRPCNACRNCLAISNDSTTDVIEIDAASNRGIDDIRDLRERVKYAPTQLGTKFYIIDEVHQITGAAANAFLKTLEEPPAHTRFILATTDPEELLPTIVSRCQRFDFRRISVDAMVGRLQTVVSAEGLTASPDALEAIARFATGSLRDAVGLLDQLSVYQEERGVSGERLITLDAVRALLGISKNERIVDLVIALADRDATRALETVNDAIDAGNDARQLNRQLVMFLRELMFLRAGASRGANTESADLAERFSIAQLGVLAKLFSEVDFSIKRSTYGQLPLEIALIEAITRDEKSVRGAVDAPRTANSSAKQQHDSVAERPQPGAQRPASSRLTDRIQQGTARRPESAAPEANVEPPLSFAPPPGVVSAPVADLQPARQAPVTRAPARDPGAKTQASETLSVDRLAELWSQIRLDVKSVDRRVEALLAAADPYDVIGNEVRLVTPYDFHARKLNEDLPRNIVADVMSRIFGQHLVVVAYQIGHEPPRNSTAALPEPPPESDALSVDQPQQTADVHQSDVIEAAQAIEPDVNNDAILEERTKAAMSIFDAVPVDAPKRPTRG